MTMAGATSTASQKRYEEELAKQKKAAEARSAEYAAAMTGANDTYKQAVGNTYDSMIQQQKDAAAQNVKQTEASYLTQFDANAAQQIAAERNLKEQMANAGLTESGFNATNQTAVQIARQNADAQTRTAKQAAVDAILQGVAEYEQKMRAEQAGLYADNDLSTQQSIAQERVTGQQQAEANAMQLSAQQAAELTALREAVDAHNQNLSAQILEAYNAGNYALARQLGAEWWSIDDAGNVVMAGRDMSQAEADARAANSAAAAQYAMRYGSSESSDKKKTDDEDTFPSSYKRAIERAEGYLADYQDYMADNTKGDAKGVIKASDEIYKIVRDGGTEISEAQLRDICVDLGINYQLIAYCISTNQLPSKANFSTFSIQG